MARKSKTLRIPRRRITIVGHGDHTTLIGPRGDGHSVSLFNTDVAPGVGHVVQANGNILIALFRGWATPRSHAKSLRAANKRTRQLAQMFGVKARTID
ncbi:MAG: hypothetical protein ACUZ8A_06485 [Candidatus Bathyanammoxibius sp.]